MQEKNLQNFIINKVESQSVYNAMVAAGQVNEDELYLIQGDSASQSVTSVNGETGDVVLSAVQYTAQTLNDDQKAQVRENIGIAEYVSSVITKKQVTSGTSFTLEDNTEYRLNNITSLSLSYPTTNFECWMNLTFATSGTISVSFPTGTKYIGKAPEFSNGETWEVSIKDKVVVAAKVGDEA